MRVIESELASSYHNGEPKDWIPIRRTDFVPLLKGKLKSAYFLLIFERFRVTSAKISIPYFCFYCLQ